MIDPPEAPPTRPRARGQRLSLAVGALIGAAGLVFVVRALWSDRDAVREALAELRPELLFTAVVLAVLAMSSIGLAWRSLLVDVGAQVSRRSALRSYFVGQLGKYVPGGAWAVIGRGEWARREGVSRLAAYNTVALSMISAYTAAALLVAVLVPVSGMIDGDARVYGLVLLLLPAGLLLMHPRVMSALVVLLRRLTGRTLGFEPPPWQTSMLLVLRQVPSWVAIGAVNVVLARALGWSPDVLDVISATAVAWIVGFLAVPVPGGIGVREAVFVAVVATLAPGPAAALALTSRLVFVVADVAGAVLFTAALGVRRSSGGAP
ncbi:MAG: lysylphosphatidylglycerol synthase domain-containing protein [Actinomycetes bacterium]